MSQDKKLAYATRDQILNLLTDEEAAKVSNSETSKNIVAGDEYLDLEDLEQGVQHANSTGAAPAHSLVPRNAVSSDTWRRIVSLLAN